MLVRTKSSNGICKNERQVSVTVSSAMLTGVGGQEEQYGDSYNDSLPVGSFFFVQIEAVLKEVTRYWTIGLHVDKEFRARQLLPAQAQCMDRPTCGRSRRIVSVKSCTKATSTAGICLIGPVGTGHRFLCKSVSHSKCEIRVHGRVPALIAEERRSVTVTETGISALLDLASSRNLRRQRSVEAAARRLVQAKPALRQTANIRVGAGCKFGKVCRLG